MMCDEHFKPKRLHQRRSLSPYVGIISIIVIRAFLTTPVKLAVNTKSIKCTAYQTADITFACLIDQSRSFDAIRDCTGSVTWTLMYNPNEKPKRGAFKQAFFGYLESPALGNTRSIVIKQCFYTSPTLGNCLPFDNHIQIKKLTAEINCLRWASALMGIVYEFINEHTGLHGPPPFPIPQMRFVKSALAIAETTHDTFLLEEVIDDAVDSGHFTKYIGNGSVKPYDFLDGDDVHRAEFLSFSQHSQFLKTKGFAFVGDFQGKNESQ